MNHLLINRQKTAAHLGQLSNITSCEYKPGVEKIVLVSHANLKVLPCPAPQTDDQSEGIPLDLPEMMQVLSEDKSFFSLLTEGKVASKEDPILIFCNGSVINGEAPYIQITDTTSRAYEVSSTPFNRSDINLKNGYQVRYVPAT